MPSAYLALSNYLNYHKGFIVMAIVSGNNKSIVRPIVQQLNIVAQIEKNIW